MPRKATETAIKQTYSLERIILAASLACYVSEEDASLDRRAFLSTVIGRIELDLETGEY